MLKSDRFLADAHWEIVEKKTLIEDPYSNNDKDFEVSQVAHGLIAKQGALQTFLS